jgi:hypothetical protein
MTKPRAVIRQKPAHPLMRDDSLHDGGEREAEDQRPQDLPSHSKRHFECAYDCIDHLLLSRFDVSNDFSIYAGESASMIRHSATVPQRH